LCNLSLSLSNSKNIGVFERIEIAKAKLTNVSIDLFLSQSTKYVDFSFISFEYDDFKMFDLLGSSMETLKLQQINLKFVDQISLKNLINLKHLDLSFNNLTFISKASFEYNTKLEHLDLNSNSLYQFDFGIVLSKLRYLNLENNRIESMSDVLYDYMSIEIFKIANNQLQAYSSFEMSQVSVDVKSKFTEIYLNNNHVERVKYFSYNFGELRVANFDSNNISFIENDAFLNCRSLEVLSISKNRLTYIAANNFHYLFSLLYLNLSFNEINFIESNSTVNLNKLKSLDLSFNKLFSIENDVFFGLVNLDHLNLFSQNDLAFYNRSFRHLVNISTIYLNASLVLKHKCIFMHHLQRDIKRNVANRYIFYKSINLITENENKEYKCDLTFHLYQFKIHLNLKTDQENDLFYTTCEETMVKKDNNFNHNLKKCLLDHKFKESDSGDDDSDRNKLNVNSVQKIFSDVWYWLVMIILFMLLGPYFILILIFEYINDFCPSLFLQRTNTDLGVRKKVNLKEFDRLIKSYMKKETRSQNFTIQMTRRKSI
jgi:Leucine-rich repeat (LRR) protein